MGRAYTEEEKLEIKRRLWEEGLKLFHSDDHEELNIRELTQNAGISLGSFYNFYEDKGSFVREIMNYRAMQKLDKMKETFAASLKNPKEYLINLIYSNYADMSGKVRTKAIYQKAFSEAFDKSKAQGINKGELKIYFDFIESLANYWNNNGYICEVDSKGIVFVVIEVIHMNSSKEYIPKKYIDNMIKDLLVSGINRYVKEI